MPPAAKRAGRIISRVLLVFLLLAVLAGAWIGVRGALALGHLRSAQTQATTLTSNVTDTAAVDRAVARIQDEMDAAHSLTSDPIWRLGQHVPYLGAQLAAVGETTNALNEMSANALGPLARVARDFDPADLAPKNGRINTGALADIGPVAQESSGYMSDAARQINTIDRRGLLPPLATAIDELADQVNQASGAVDGIARASELLPAFLGADGKRSYLVLGQNNAEWRSLGGMVGAMFVMDTNKGRINFRDYYAETDFDHLAKPVVDLPKPMRELFQPNPALKVQNVTQVPKFAQSATIAQAAWKKRKGQPVDGVIAIDPVTLSYLLKATGPVNVPVGGGATTKVTAENAVELLLNKVYLKYPVEVQDAIFQATTAAVFDKIMNGGVEPRELLAALTQASAERRVLVWSDNKSEQAALDGTKLQGPLPVTDANNTRFGVYVNDGTGSKLSYYMKLETGATWCRVDGDTGDAVVKVTLRNAAPKNASSLPDTITGSGYYGTKKGLTRNLAYIYLPKGAEVLLTDTAGVGTLGGFGRGTHNGLNVLTWETLLEPGQTASTTIRVRGQWTQNLEVQSTPIIPGNHTAALPACS